MPISNLGKTFTGRKSKRLQCREQKFSHKTYQVVYFLKYKQKKNINKLNLVKVKAFAQQRKP